MSTPSGPRGVLREPSEGHRDGGAGGAGTRRASCGGGGTTAVAPVARRFAGGGADSAEDDVLPVSLSGTSAPDDDEWVGLAPDVRLAKSSCLLAWFVLMGARCARRHRTRTVAPSRHRSCTASHKRSNERC